MANYSHRKNRKLITDKTSALDGLPSPHFYSIFNQSQKFFQSLAKFFQH